jgi:hypothetical protein
MKWTIGFAVVALALGIWSGVRAEQSGAVMVIPAGLAMLIGCHFVLCLWLWYRARPGSGDAMVMPVVALVSASMLCFILPRVFWPAAKGVQIAGSIVSITVPMVLLIMQIRRRRSLRRGARPV